MRFPAAPCGPRGGFCGSVGIDMSLMIRVEEQEMKSYLDSLEINTRKQYELLTYFEYYLISPPSQLLRLPPPILLRRIL
jgi:hypothetical protein